ncbi:hypothetical protein A8B75_11675 [Sphingomonadales bacterium EhC05]|nr:hypothetical protein A8B75_11675 [Sphingomonadales bacterium EhC05]
MMRRKIAAKYLDMSEASFLREVASLNLPMPVLIGKKEYWYREAIDKAVAILFGVVEPDWSDIALYDRSDAKGT